MAGLLKNWRLNYRRSNLITSNAQKLTLYLDRVCQLYDIDTLLSEPVDTSTIIQYYTKSSWLYSIFHSMRGAVHMAVSSDAIFKRDDYYAQPRYMLQHMRDQGPEQVLEIASGKGFNTTYMARQFPDVTFTGVDLTPAHVAIASAKAHGMKLHNTIFVEGDFHALSFDDAQFDMAFVVESLCHTQDLRRSLESIYRVLKPGCTFVLFDTLKSRVDDLSDEERLAVRLIEYSVALTDVPSRDDFLTTAKSVGFSVDLFEDISQTTRPNLRRFEQIARWFFVWPPLSVSRLLLRVLPKYLTRNSIAGLLLPISSEENLLGYYRIVLRRW